MPRRTSSPVSRADAPRGPRPPPRECRGCEPPSPPVPGRCRYRRNPAGSAGRPWPRGARPLTRSRPPRGCSTARPPSWTGAASEPSSRPGCSRSPQTYGRCGAAAPCRPRGRRVGASHGCRWWNRWSAAAFLPRRLLPHTAAAPAPRRAPGRRGHRSGAAPWYPGRTCPPDQRAPSPCGPACGSWHAQPQR